jgi:hypothetical protein
MSDAQKWRVRPKLSPRVPSASKVPGYSGLPPCFFIPPGAVDQSVLSGSVADCLLLVPDGKDLNLFEVTFAGDFVPIKTDLSVTDVIPLAFTRSYRPLNDKMRHFHYFITDVYDPYLYGDQFPYTYAVWSLPDGLDVYYRRVSQGSGYADAIFEHSEPTTTFGGSRIGWNGDGWDLTMKDGTTYLSPEAYRTLRPKLGSLSAIFDESGNEVRVLRNSVGDLTQIKSPNGSWIRFSYDNKGRIAQVVSSATGWVKYLYDSEDRLVSVGYSTGQTIKYSFDSANRMVTVEDSRPQFRLANKYDSAGRIMEVSTDPGGLYKFRYLVDDTDIIDPHGKLTRVHVTLDKGNLSYTTEEATR